MFESALEYGMQNCPSSSVGQRRAADRLHQTIMPKYPLADVGDLYY